MRSVDEELRKRLPTAVGAATDGATWEPVSASTGRAVWRAARQDTVCFVKVGPDGGPDGIAAEVKRLDWLAGRAAVPEVLAHAVDEDGQGWLVTAEAAGLAAHDPLHRMASVEPLLGALGRGLRGLHDSLPVDGCPFDARLDLVLAHTEARAAAGMVDVDGLEPAYRRFSVDQLLERVHETRPAEPAEDLVVTHGDPCLPNLLVDPAVNEVTGVLDVGRLGVSDRYRDLGIALRSIARNLGPEVAWRFLDAYGLPHPDLQRLEYYVLLDELW